LKSLPFLIIELAVYPTVLRPDDSSLIETLALETLRLQDVDLRIVANPTIPRYS
jgi:hypothetical protein